MKQSEDSLMDLWDTIEQIKICIIGALEEEKKDRGRTKGILKEGRKK